VIESIIDYCLLIIWSEIALFIDYCELLPEAAEANQILKIKMQNYKVKIKNDLATKAERHEKLNY